MRTLLDDRYAPITSAVGFLDCRLDEAVRGLTEWREELYGSVETSKLSGFPSALESLLPLTTMGVRPRELLVEAGSWTAYFDCGFRGTDAVSTMGYLAKRLRKRGLAIRAVPHTLNRSATSGRAGSVQFELFGPLDTEFLNYVRTLAATWDGSRWEWDAWGTPQWFERLDHYKARRVRDRFTAELLDQYCQALGLDVFCEQFYGPRATLVRSAIEPPPTCEELTLEETQHMLHIRPSVDATA